MSDITFTQFHHAINISSVPQSYMEKKRQDVYIHLSFYFESESRRKINGRGSVRQQTSRTIWHHHGDWT